MFATKEEVPTSRRVANLKVVRPYVIEMLQSDIRQARATLRAKKREIVSSHSVRYALEWGVEQMIEAEVKKSLANELLCSIACGYKDRVKSGLGKKLVRLARHRSKSTSQISNLSHQIEVKEVAEMLSRLERLAI